MYITHSFCVVCVCLIPPPFLNLWDIISKSYIYTCLSLMLRDFFALLDFTVFSGNVRPQSLCWKAISLAHQRFPVRPNKSPHCFGPCLASGHRLEMLLGCSVPSLPYSSKHQTQKKNRTEEANSTANTKRLCLWTASPLPCYAYMKRIRQKAHLYIVKCAASGLLRHNCMFMGCAELM